jgi:hypothetical protein
MTKKLKKNKQKSMIKRNLGVLKSNLPALTPQEEHELVEQAIAEEAIERMGG